MNILRKGYWQLKCKGDGIKRKNNKYVWMEPVETLNIFGEPTGNFIYKETKRYCYKPYKEEK